MEVYSAFLSQLRVDARKALAVLLERARWLYAVCALSVCVWFASTPDDTTHYVSTHASLAYLGLFALFHTSILLFIISFNLQPESIKAPVRRPSSCTQ